MTHTTDWDLIISRLKWRDLRVLLAVAEQRSMGKAASTLGISQPAVSQTIRDLEASIKAPLFERSSSGVKPTIYGAKLIEGCLKASDVLKETFRGIEYLADPYSGELSIGCPEVVAAILPCTIGKLITRHPRLSIKTIDISAPTLDIPQLREGKIDAAVLRVAGMPAHRSEYADLNVEALYFDETVVIAGAGGVWAKQKDVRLQDVAAGSWILPPRETLNFQVIEAAFREAGRNGPSVRIVSFSLQLRLGLVASSDFLSVLPRSLVKIYANQFPVVAIPLVLPARNWPLVLVTMRGKPLNPSVELLAEQLRTDLAQL